MASGIDQVESSWLATHQLLIGQQNDTNDSRPVPQARHRCYQISSRFPETHRSPPPAHPELGLEERSGARNQIAVSLVGQGRWLSTKPPQLAYPLVRWTTENLNQL